ncbi:MFS transporter [Foetidibacter luteolus]|uniref:MFS transporter n=1 Tax=Foetidibacter luteolus TaxID=2608880 RepID=UPI00129AAC07|nr:MFS transporter [Foetidibacter luteolus]
MKHQWKPLLLVCYVFLFTGAIICMNDILLPSLKAFFNLSYYRATLVQQSFYLVYLVFPVPIAFYIARYGYKNALVTALFICGAGGLLFLPAYTMSSFVFALAAVFIISIGVTLVNVAANPLAALLGHPKGSHIRVNIVQLFSRIGYSFTPVLATRLIHGEAGTIKFDLPYLVIGAGAVLLAVGIGFSAMPSMKPEVEKGFTLPAIVKGAAVRPQLLWGAVIMFFYVGAEASTAGFFTSYLSDPAIAGFSNEQTAGFLTAYYVIAAIVSLLGIYLLRFISPGKLVAVFGVGMVVLFLLISLTHSVLNPYLLTGLGVFISIMFPSLFSLGIEGLGDFTEKGSALINTAVVGGAVFPPLQGLVADAYGIQVSYLIPCACFLLIIFYGVYCDRRARKLQSETSSFSSQ